MSIIHKAFFGASKKGLPVNQYTLKNTRGMEAKILEYGCALTSLLVPDKDGKLQDVVLGYDTLPEYEASPYYMGTIVGRCANRIAGGLAPIDGTTYQLSLNEKGYHLHGGFAGFNAKVWTGEIKDDRLVLHYTSPDMEEGYPGQLEVQVTYHLTEENALTIVYEASTSRPTLCNLTNHAYFNLNGPGAMGINNHKVKINADFYTPVTAENIPDGTLAKVAGTPLDFRQFKLLNELLASAQPSGFDSNWAVRSYDETLQEVASAYCPATNILLQVDATLPGVQFYTGNFLTGKGKYNRDYGKFSGFCFEPQYFPNAVSHPNFAAPILRPESPYNHTIRYRFSHAM